MVFSSDKRAGLPRGLEQGYSVEGKAFLENLAVAPRGRAEFQRRGAGGAMERTHEIGEVAETDIIGDVGDRAVVVGQPPRRMAQPRAHQILVRGDAERVR